jgi:type II secretory pathway component PulK
MNVIRQSGVAASSPKDLGMAAARVRSAICRGGRGLALIAVLWIVIVMAAIIAVVGQTGRLDAKMSMSVLDETRCRWACRAGTETAIAVLNEDTKDSDCLTDLWSSDDTDFNDIQLERCVYRVTVTDEAGKFNVNTATKEQLMALPTMTTQIADAIMDWRDNDDEVSAEGAERGYYDNLRYPYTIRNGPLRTVRELLRVKGITEQQLYGDDTSLNGQAPPVQRGAIYNPGWIKYLTCYSYDNNVDAQGQSRVNINQGSEQDLQSKLGISAGQARWITQNRGSGFKGIGDLISDSSPKESSGGSNSGSGGGGSQNNSGSNPSGSGGNRGNSGGPGNSGGNPGNSGGGNPNQPAEQLDLQTFRRIVDKVTVTSETKVPGRVNINTASEEVLTALFGGDDTARAIALAIIGDRAGRTYGFQSIGDLLDVSSVGITKFKFVADRITVRSNVFMIQCIAMATISRAKLKTECVVDRGSNPCTILYWYQGANN